LQIPAYAIGSVTIIEELTARVVGKQRDIDNRKYYKHVGITTNHPDTKSYPNPNPNPNPTTKQHATVNIQLNIVACPAFPDKFMRVNVIAPLLLL